MNEKLIAYSRLVAIAASQNRLDAEAALTFCAQAVPQLLAELEVLSRVNAKFETVLQLTPQPEPTPAAASPAKKPRKARKKKARAK